MKVPFIPRDKPKFWVLFTLSCLCGLSTGALALGASSLGLHAASWLMTILLMFFCVAGAICWLGVLTFWVLVVYGVYHSRIGSAA